MLENIYIFIYIYIYIYIYIIYIYIRQTLIIKDFREHPVGTLWEYLGTFRTFVAEQQLAFRSL